jgi:selenocysteine-specific elongation factor
VTDRGRLVVGVIGHVDHGKTALVGALTGMQTDRLAEEQRRGISIALGFAHFQAGGVTLDLIDMPGHERFVRTMVAGATGIDAALLVVAANEGIKPQTVEHLDIAMLLGVRRIVVAVSKADLVAPAEAAAAAGAAAALVRSLGLEVCASVATSARTGQGIADLRDGLVRAAAGGAAAAEDGFAYLPIDRVFSIAGHGTVVTGTLQRGRLAVSDDVAILPDGAPVRLRGLQVHGARVTEALPGQRVAANLRDVPADAVARGQALATRGLLAANTWLTVQLRTVAAAPVLENAARLILLVGTAEVEVRLRLLEGDALEAGATTLAQLRCAAPVSVPARELFVLRRASPPQTVAGGRVIDPGAVRLRRRAPTVLARLAALAEAEPGDILRLEVAAAGAAGVPLARLAALAGLAEAPAAAALQTLPVVLGRSRVAVSRAAFERVSDALRAALATQEREVSIDRLAAMVPWAGRTVLEDAAAELVRRGVLARAGGGLRLPAPLRDQARADQDAEAAGRLAEALLRAGLSPPAPHALASDPQARRLLDRLIREGVVIRTVDRVQKREVLFHAAAVEAAQRLLAPLLASGPGVLVSEAGTALGISRKFCVPLLEHFDAIRFTRRVADRRVLARSVQTPPDAA